MTELRTLEELAMDVGYSYDHLRNMRRQLDGFPEPAGQRTVKATKAMLYRKQAVVDWLRRHGKRLAGGDDSSLTRRFLTGHYLPEQQRLARQCKQQAARLRNIKTCVVHIRGEI